MLSHPPVALATGGMQRQPKRKTKVSTKAAYKIGSFEAGLVTHSAHPVNNIYLKIFDKNRRRSEMDLTVDEAAAIIHVLGAAIIDYTVSLREVLTPKV
jgi:hypothetical protein